MDIETEGVANLQTDSDIIINVVESPVEEVETEESFDLIHYNGYNIKFVKETGGI